jgi:hypothetical protein
VPKTRFSLINVECGRDFEEDEEEEKWKVKYQHTVVQQARKPRQVSKKCVLILK